MDGSRSDRPVNPARPDQKQLLRGPPKNKLLKVPGSAPVELTPLTRLAKFKEIRDRNLAKASSTSNPRRSNLVAHLSSAKMMTNGSDGKSNTNDVVPASNGKSEQHEEPRSPVKPKSALKNGVELEDPSLRKSQPSPKKTEQTPSDSAPSAQNGVDAVGDKSTGSSSTNGVDSRRQVEPLEQVCHEIILLEEEDIEAGTGSDADGGLDSEGSSLEVVIDESSSAESLDLNISAVSPEDFLTPLNATVDEPSSVPGPSGSTQEPASNENEQFIPDVIKRLNSGGHISSRPSLRGKRKQEDDTNSLAHKRRCDDSSSVASLSTSWQFFSASSALNRVWHRQGEQPAVRKSEDDSMLVNVSTEQPKSQRWCSIMLCAKARNIHHNQTNVVRSITSKRRRSRKSKMQPTAWEDPSQNTKFKAREKAAQ